MRNISYNTRLRFVPSQEKPFLKAARENKQRKMASETDMVSSKVVTPALIKVTMLSVFVIKPATSKTGYKG